MSNGHWLLKLTDDEINFFRSRQGHHLRQAFQEYQAGETSPRLIETIHDAFSQLSDVWQKDRIFNNVNQCLITEDEKLTADSFITQFKINIVPDFLHDPEKHGFNILNSSINKESCFLTERPLPVRIRKRHLEKRFTQRTNFNETDFDTIINNEDVIDILSVAMGYVRLCDGNTNWPKVGEVPFAIAGKNGLFLGVITPSEEVRHWNRLSFGAASLGHSLPLSPYLWIPECAADIKTFIGFQDFKATQKALYITLRKFINAHLINDLSYGVFGYQNTKEMLPSDISSSPTEKAYEKALEVLRSLTCSKTWRSGVRAPNMQYLGNGVLKPKF